MNITTLSEQFSTLSVSQEIPADLANILAKKQKIHYMPNAPFWRLASNHFFKGQQSKKFINFPRETVEPFLFLNINISYQNLRPYLEKLDQMEINLNKWREQGLTLFHLVGITGNQQLIKPHFFETINNIDTKGRTALQLSAFFGHLEIAKKLIQFGANPFLCAPIYGPALAQAILGKEPSTILFFKNLTREKENQPSPLGYPSFLAAEIAVKSIALCYSKCYSNPSKKELFNQKINDSQDPILLKKYYAQEKIRRTFYHSWKIDWKLKIDDLIIPHKIFLDNTAQRLEFPAEDGGYTRFFLHRMAKSTANFAEQPYTNLIYDPGCLSTLKEALDFAANQKHLPVSTILERIQSKMFTILSISVAKHAVNAVFYGRFFALCNRGYLSRKSIELFYFDNSRLSEAILQKMLSGFDPGAYNQFFFTDLKEQLNLYQLPMEQELEKLVALPDQLIGNCSWESAETSSYLGFVLPMLKQANLLSPKKFTIDKAFKVITKCNYQFHNWLLFQQLEHLENYLKLTAEPNREFVSNHEMYLETAKEFTQKKWSPLTHPELLEQMLSIEKRYPEFTAFYKFLRK